MQFEEYFENSLPFAYNYENYIGDVVGGFLYSYFWWKKNVSGFTYSNISKLKKKLLLLRYIIYQLHVSLDVRCSVLLEVSLFLRKKSITNKLCGKIAEYYSIPDKIFNNTTCNNSIPSSTVYPNSWTMSKDASNRNSMWNFPEKSTYIMKTC